MFFIDQSEALDGKIVIVEIKGPLTRETTHDFEDYINTLLGKKKVFIILNRG